MSNKRQTAVDWHHEKVSNMIEQLKRKYVNQEEFLDSLLKIRNQAKEMEKEQHRKTYNQSLMSNFQSFDDYYTETYNTTQP